MLAQRWSTNPQWLLDECPYWLREAGLDMMYLESAATFHKDAATRPTEKIEGRESFTAIRERRLREKREREREHSEEPQQRYNG